MEQGKQVLAATFVPASMTTELSHGQSRAVAEDTYETVTFSISLHDRKVDVMTPAMVNHAFRSAWC